MFRSTLTRALGLTATLTLLALALGVLAGAHPGGLATVLEPELAHAQSCGSPGVPCPANTPKQSILKVDHLRIKADLPYYIQPATGETWEGTIVWSSDGLDPDCQCLETTATVTFRVDWIQATNSWRATCLSGCDPVNGPVRGIDICNGVGCMSPGPLGLLHQWQYWVRLAVDPSVSICDNDIAYLHHIDYVTRVVDNGNPIVGPCNLGPLTTPTSQTFSVTDTGAYQPAGTFMCFPDCDGPTPVVITYN